MRSEEPVDIVKGRGVGGRRYHRNLECGRALWDDWTYMPTH